jgi:methylated-DNA-[protein]-cysteine S-methyltransferase
MLSDKVYILVNKIPKGKVTTYKIIAKKLNTKGYRAIGQVLNKNPNAPKVPCHRVIKSDGTIGGYAKGKVKKKEILRKEGIEFRGDRIINFDKVLEKFK